MNDITQNQLEGFGDKSVNCSEMILLKTEFILFIFVIVMMKSFHKSPTSEYITKLKSTPQPHHF